ncbi:TonB-dependent receptor [Rubrivivax sp. A210]|uniref:TonB-dependent receptor n=1 Tax=Rubrivivax sp. A210 TaxID=2772301 RepID=UPI001919D464|nr:TonB-dependent receptor [Rubrivivax sp. A210]CAD5367005.1 TonB-dependent receptor [Rubrivivax sp. A210]
MPSRKNAPRCLHPLALASIAATAALAPAWAQAQVQSQTVEIFGVSPLSGVDVPRERIPANVQGARAADIERSQALDLTSFMNRRLGSVFINEVQNNPFQPDVNFRGFTASPLLGTQQGLSLYVDGVRMNQPFGDVVSWDLVPKSAIASMALNPGSNPLFGLNTLGGALVVQTKDGRKNPGSSVQVQAGSHGRAAVEFEHGGRSGELHWFVTGNKFHEKGWRDDSKSDMNQLFAKLGRRSGDTDLTLTASVADTDLNGNGMQVQHLLERDYASVYTKPDNTKNRAFLLNLALSQGLSEHWTLTGNAYYRRIKTRTYNGDLNDDSLDQALYQPNADEILALTDAGYTGFPTAGESPANTPFPKWRCIANALLLDEPAEKCTGVINQTSTNQSHYGLSGQLNFDGKLLGMDSKSLLGVALDFSRSHFIQGSELGYVNADRSITGVGAIGDGVNGGVADGEPYDTRVDLSGRTRIYSLFGSTILNVAPGTHLTLSGRYNHSSVRNRDAITPGGGAGSLDGDHSFSRFNPALGLTFTPMAGINAWAGISQGSRDPSSIELGCADPANPCKLPNSFAGDPPLQQVVTTTFEAGVRGGSAGQFAWSLGFFRSDNKDDLLFVADNASGFGYFKNFGKTRRQGIELGLSLQPAKGVTVGANYTWLQATYRSAEVVNGSSNSSNESAEDGFPGVEGTIDIHPGDRIPLVPRQMLKLYADIDIGDAWSFGADVNAVGRTLARGNENGHHQSDGVFYLGEGHSAGYSVLNLNAAWKPTKGLKLFVQINNALDRNYSSAAQLGPTGFDDAGNFQSRPFAADANGDRPLRHATFYAPGAPRSFSVGLKYSF